MNEVSQQVANHIIDTVQRGVPPEHGFQYFTAGLDPYLSVLENEYFSDSYLRQGGSVFKLVVGVYGGGKTHLLYCIRELAWKHGYAVSYVSLSPEESPFHELEKVYGVIVRGIMPPLTPEELMSGYEQGVESFIKSWVAQKQHELTSRGYSGDQLRDEMLKSADGLAGIESTSFHNAVRVAFKAVVENDEDTFRNICQWLKGEGYVRGTHAKHGILEKIDRSTAFKMIRSLIQWVREIGYGGLTVLLDEGGQKGSMGKKDIDRHLNNLRQVVDSCGQSTLKGAAIFYAVPDLNFLDGKTGEYTALKGRLANEFEAMNPRGVKIELEKTIEDPVPFLEEVGRKLADVYERAYGHTFDELELHQMIESCAEEAWTQRFADTSYKRAFVTSIVRKLGSLHHAEDSMTHQE